MSYAHLAENDRRCLTYTTGALARDVVVVGHPVVKLFVASSAEDADVFVLLEEVGAADDVRYVTEGVLRASHRALGDAPWNNESLPFQPTSTPTWRSSQGRAGGARLRPPSHRHRLRRGPSHPCDADGRRRRQRSAAPDRARHGPARVPRGTRPRSTAGPPG
jgi:hypothetical protein